MQLLAREGEQTLSTKHAQKGKIYYCPECAAPVRLRSGPHRTAHFYHTQSKKNCRQNQKTLEHLQLQIRLLQLFGVENAAMEFRFPEIERIADIVWHTERCVFEIQCSPISLLEAKQRCSDYQNAGYRLIWILHDNRFNQKKLSSAELFLRTQPCYFTCADRNGQGIVYDQFEILSGHRRLFKGPPLEVQIDQLFPQRSIEGNLPSALMTRIEQWPLFAAGDLTHRLLTSPGFSHHCAHLAHLAHLENNYHKLPERVQLWKLLRGLYVWILDKALLNLSE